MGQEKLKITDLYIYPIKSLRPLSVDRTQLRREGLRYDRRFMLLKVEPDGRHKNIQVVRFPECALFEQAIEGDHVVVRYRIPERPLVVPVPPEQRAALRVPLNPPTADLATVDIKLFGSNTPAHRMGDPYDTWFTACFGYSVILVYIGDNRRQVLAHSPQPERQQQGQSWLSYVASFVPSYGRQQDQAKEPAGGLAFNEAAPFLLTSKASLRDVSARLPEGQVMDMIKFRPNIVVDLVSEDSLEEEEGEEKDGEDDSGKLLALNAWDEDFWAELQVGASHRLALTANCARCVSINVDYETGRTAEGELGAVLKKLMRDRRVDAGNKWSPIFGRYAFLLPPANGAGDGGGVGEEEEENQIGADVAVGDEVKVTRRISERDTWAWPK